MTPREAAGEIWRAGLASVEPEAAVRRHVRAVLPRVGRAGKVWVVGAGKGAAAMARGVGGELDLAGGCLAAPGFADAPVSLHVGSHPLPSAASIAAGEAVAALVASVPPEDLICAVWSGGGSASIAAPHPGQSLEALIALSTGLLRSGLPIAAVNTVRRRAYRWAGGRLRALSRAPILSLGLCDVPPGPLASATVASGPTVADPTSRADAKAILASAGLDGFSALLADDVEVRGGMYRMVGSASDVVHAASHRARSLGWVPVVLSAWEDRPADLTVLRVDDAARAAAGGPPLALLLAGEPAVKVAGRGFGGRCQHAAARLAGAIAGRPITALLAGLDGIDGNTLAAGGLVDGGTRERAGSDPEGALGDGDGGSWLEAAGDRWITGPTGTACCDLWVVLVGAP